MLSSKQIEAIQPRIRTLQIICAALIGGILMFGLCLSLVGAKEPNQSLEFLTQIGLGLAVVGAGASIFYPTGFRNAAMRQFAKKGPSADHLAAGAFVYYQTAKIIGMALLEGPAFFNLVVWMMDGSIYNLGAVIALFAIMVLGFPTSGKVIASIEDMIDAVGGESSQ